MERIALRSGTVDLAARAFVRLDGSRHGLTAKEVALVRHLATNAGRVVPRSELLARIWDYSPHAVTRVVDTAVSRLRAKIEVDPQHPDHLLTAFGDGYLFLRDALPVRPLPPEPDALLGRDAAFAAAEAALAEPGVVVLVGAPGVGKTRLALRLAHDQAGTWSGGSVYVDLTLAASAVARELAVALQMTVPESARELEQRLLHTLSARGPTLLVLDNCEAATDGVRDAVVAWCACQPELRVLATGRTPLGVPGERVIAVEPLDRDAAIDLFLRKAEGQAAPWLGDPSAREQVGALVDGLDRNPLAIELAAGRASALNPAQLLERLTERFRLLRSRSRDTVSRHQTLEAAVGVSWDPLDPDDQRALAASSVFRGPFDGEAAAAVLGSVEVLDRLCARSLLVRSEGRYRSFLFLRDYAAARLATDREAERAAQERHFEHYAARSAALPAHRRATELAADRSNLEVATERAVAAGRADVAGRTVVALADVVEQEGPLDLLVEPLQRVLTLTGLSRRAEVERALAAALLVRGDDEGARELLERALVRERGSAVQGILQVELSTLHRQRGRLDEAREAAIAGLRVAREAGDRALEGKALRRLATIDHDQGRSEAASEGYAAALACHRAIGDRRFEGITATNLGALLVHTGDDEGGLRQLERALAIHREVGDRRFEATTLANLGMVHRSRGNLGEARTYYEAALRVLPGVGDRRTEGVVLTGLAGLHHSEGRTREARIQLEAALVALRAVGSLRHEAVALANLAIACREDSELDEARAHLERAVELHRGIGDRRNEGASLGDLAVVAHLQGRTDDARSGFEAALATLADLDPTEAAAVRYAFGDALRERGAHHEARAHLEAALAVQQAHGDARAECQTLVALAALALAEDAPRRAEALADHARTVALAAQHRAAVAEASIVLAEVRRRGGDLAASRAALTEAEPLVQGLRQWVALLVARARLEQAEDEPAADTVAEARALAERLGAGDPLAALVAALPDR